MKRVIIFISFFIILGATAYSQSPQFTIVSYDVLPSQDTVRIVSNYGSWWFGPIGGYNQNLYFQTLNTDLFYNTENPFNFPISYKSGSGRGWYAGFTVEYLPPEKYWGFGIDIMFPDVRYANATTKEIVFDKEYLMSYKSDYSYFSLAPYARYNFKKSGLHAFGGVLLDINYDMAGNQQIIEEVVDNIIHDDSLAHENMKFRYGISLGAGWDILMYDVNNRVRTRFTPYVSANFGSKILSDNGSSWNEVLFKVGLKIKFGMNKATFDTSEYRYVEPVPKYVAAIVPERGVEFIVEARKSNVLPALDIAIVEKKYDETIMIIPTESELTGLEGVIEQNPGEIGGGSLGADNLSEELLAEIDMEPEFIRIAGRGINVILPKGKERNVRIRAGETSYYSFSTSVSTEISESLGNYLDELVKQMKANPNWIVYIDGHTDSRGTTQSKLDISKRRADNTKAYLVKRGITGGRIFPRGQSDLLPLQPNTTEEGRQANRRVEVRVFAP